MGHFSNYFNDFYLAQDYKREINLLDLTFMALSQISPGPSALGSKVRKRRLQFRDQLVCEALF